MSDRELLELAAKAAGVKRELMDNGEPFYVGSATGHEWNPLDYDDDALRLAVKTGVCIVIADGFVIAQRFYADAQNLGSHREEAALNDAAPVRRAIVRAAAEIGRQM